MGVLRISAARAAIAAAGLWSAALPAAAQVPGQGQAPAVVVARAELRDLTQQREFVGRVRALERVELRARIEGVLRERRFVEGAMVAAGDLLFAIEPDQFEASLDLARSEVAKAEATLADATSQSSARASCRATRTSRSRPSTSASPTRRARAPSSSPRRPRSARPSSRSATRASSPRSRGASARRR